jgi:hypothetical protein
MNTLQVLYFQRALQEEGIGKSGFGTAHHIPQNYNGGKVYNFVFPKSFLAEIEKLDYKSKPLDYIFLGSIVGPHREFLRNWNIPNSLIKTTSENNYQHPGHTPEAYGANYFNVDYFTKMCRAKFALAPGGASAFNPAYPEQHLWTYRFWEACLAKAIPVTNEPDPKWHTDYKFYSLDDNHVYNQEWANHNYELVKERHFIWIKD